MSIIPVEVPTGAIRYNTDSNKMECFNGTKWYEISVSSPDLNGGARGLITGQLEFPDTTSVNIDYVTISTAGDATDFGDLSQERGGLAAIGSRTRGVFMGGQTENPDAFRNTIDYVEFASTSNATDFGDLNDTSSYQKGLSNNTRGINAGGYNPTINDIIDYITIASAANAVDFGNLAQTTGGGPGGAASPTRGVFSGGYHPSPGLTSLNTLQYITIATTGNTQDFGDMTTLRSHNAQANSSTRSVIAMGYNKTPSTGSYDNQETSEYYTFATLGNSVNFGDMIASTGYSPGGCSNCIRGLWSGGSAIVNTIQYVSIATLGDAVDFGDLNSGVKGGWLGACSNGHGGLG